MLTACVTLFYALGVCAHGDLGVVNIVSPIRSSRPGGTLEERDSPCAPRRRPRIVSSLKLLVSLEGDLAVIGLPLRRRRGCVHEGPRPSEVPRYHTPPQLFRIKAQGTRRIPDAPWLLQSLNGDFRLHSVEASTGLSQS